MSRLAVKLLRDLVQARWQFVAISLVAALGVASSRASLSPAQARMICWLAQLLCSNNFTKGSEDIAISPFLLKRISANRDSLIIEYLF